MKLSVKSCAQCHRKKPYSQFARHPKAFDGRQKRCRTCVRDSYRGTPERAPLIDLNARGPAYHQCGELLVFGSDDGRGVEYCDRCQFAEYTRPDPQRWRAMRLG